MRIVTKSLNIEGIRYALIEFIEDKQVSYGTVKITDLHDINNMSKEDMAVVAVTGEGPDIFADTVQKAIWARKNKQRKELFKARLAEYEGR